MSKSRERAEGFVGNVLEHTRDYVQGLLGENARLRKLVATYETELSRNQEEKLKLHERMLELREEVESYRADQARLQRQLQEIEQENEAFADQFLDIEEQNASLANLYVASYRLHGDLEREKVLEAILEIIINLVGSEEVAVLELDPESQELVVAATFGLDWPIGSHRTANKGLIASSLRSGELWCALRGEGEGEVPTGDEAHLSCCIPLKVGSRVIGAIAIFRLLQQKEGYDETDLALFDLLATHAAVALYSGSLEARLAAGVEARVSG
ncbi:MAG: GAF domain-containing protein [Deltaproteobacteria bacterium]|nr:GAF domain-containing protein [Deltaproteobacteria bacterium]